MLLGEVTTAGNLQDLGNLEGFFDVPGTDSIYQDLKQRFARILPPVNPS
jgi:hypothetical protein